MARSSSTNTKFPNVSKMKSVKGYRVIPSQLPRFKQVDNAFLLAIIKSKSNTISYSDVRKAMFEMHIPVPIHRSIEWTEMKQSATRLIKAGKIHMVGDAQFRIGKARPYSWEEGKLP